MFVELWKEIPGYESLYMVSSQGRILSLRTGLLRRDVQSGHGYRGIQLSDMHGKKKRHYVHRLVALAFLGAPPSESSVVNHINLNKRDNSLENLEWCSVQENNHHAYVNGKTDFHRNIRSDNKTGMPGVCPHSGGYEVSLNGHYVGWRKSLDAAVSLRKEAEMKVR